MLRLTNVTKSFKSGKHHTMALRKVTLTISKGEFVTVLGPSGCGKSTLLHVLGLIEKPTDGSLIYKGTEMFGLSEWVKAKVRKSDFGFIFQNFNLIDQLTVFQNIELPLIYKGVEQSLREEKVNHMIHSFGLDIHKHHLPAQLSGGLQQRVAIARAIVGDPDVIFADEPTGNLDSANSRTVMQSLKFLNESGKTIVMVTHSAEDATYASRIVRMIDGQIVMERNAVTSE